MGPPTMPLAARIASLKPRPLARALAAVPAGPSCSRWLTCSCCRVSPAAVPRPPARRQVSSASSAIPPIASLRNMQTPHLPLPPTLPYSPTSQPFVRHLQILSLSLLSGTADESWAIYSAVHESLRPAIPDDVFASLLRHQLTAPARERWPRVTSLIALARSCDMAACKLGATLLESLYLDGTRAMRFVGGEAWWAIEADLRWLWDGLVREHQGAVAALPLRVRRQRVRLYLRGDVRRRQLRAIAHFDELVAAGAAGGLDHEARKIVMLSGLLPDERMANVRRAAQSLALGFALSDEELYALVQRAHAAAQGAPQQRMDAVSSVVNQVIADIRAEGRDDLAGRFARALRRCRDSHQSPASRIRAALGGTPSAAHLSRLAHRLLRDPKADLALAIDLCEAALASRGDCAALCAMVVARVTSGDLVCRLATIIVDGEHAARLNSTSLHLLFVRLVTALPDNTAYMLARKLYATVRAADPAFKWTTANVNVFSALYHYAIGAPRRQLHFASRLYADYTADGMALTTATALDTVRAIGASPNASRPVLLERHIGDYQYARGPAADLCAALADGLAQTAGDGMLAYQLCRRVMGAEPLPPRAAERIATALARSGQPEHARVVLGLLVRVPAAAAGPICDRMLSSATRSGSFDLARVLVLYRAIVARGTAPSGDTVSTLIRALLQGDHLDAALALFDTAMRTAARIRSAAVGRLMVNLAVADRASDADRVERQWRATGPTYDKGVVGARVIVHVMRGEQVDIQAIARKTGWTPTKPFLRYIDSIRATQQARGAIVEDALDVAAEPVRAGHDTRRTKTAVQPLTRSLEGARWLLDHAEDRDKGVHFFVPSI